MPHVFALKFSRLPLYLLLALFAALAVACGSGDDGESVIGEVISVEARSITEFETLTVIDSNGKTWEFTGGAFTGFTPSHLREHQALGDPVQVWYVEVDGTLRVTRIGDG